MKSYHDLLRHALEHGEQHADRTGVGTTSVFGAEWRHSLLGDSPCSCVAFPLVTTRRISLDKAVSELKWMLSGSTNVADLQARGVSFWDAWATEEQCARWGREIGELGPTYGRMWRGYPVGILPGEMTHSYTDQIACLLRAMRDTPNSRRLIVSAWHPHYSTRLSVPPCQPMWQVRCHDMPDGKREISLRVDCRSQDAFLGLPYDIASHGALLMMLGWLTGRCPRELIMHFGDLHIYDNHQAQVTELLSRKPRALPTVKLMPEPLEIGLITQQEAANGWRDRDKLSQVLDGWRLITEGYDPYPTITGPIAC